MIGAVLGFLGALVPRLIEILNDRAKGKSRAAREALDHLREMQMMILQAELADPAPGPEVHGTDVAQIKQAKKAPTPSVTSGVKLLDHAHEASTAIGKWPISIAFLGYSAMDIVISTVRPVVTYGVLGVWAAWKLLQFQSGGPVEWLPFEDDMILFIITFYFGGRAIQRERK